MAAPPADLFEVKVNSNFAFGRISHARVVRTVGQLLAALWCQLPPSTLRELFADLLQHGAAFACPRTLASINLAVSLGPAASLSFMSLL